MKNVYKILLLTLIAIFAWACDEIKQVPAPVSPLAETPLINIKVIYTLPNSFVAFDTKDLLIKTQGFTSLKIENLPQFGKINFNKTGLLVYKSDSAKAEASELLIYKIINTDPSKTKQDTLRVIVTTDLNKIPCNAGVIPDFFTVKVNTPTILNVLKNDRFCNSILDSTTLEIVEKPLLGTASIQNNRILYAPRIGSDDNDTFLYRICTGGASPKCMIAGVKINVEGNTCRSILMPDLLLMNSNITTPQIIKVLDNDKICDNYDKKSLKISIQPRFGKAVVNGNSEIEYTQTVNRPAVDALEYTIFDKDGKNSLRMIAEIYVKDVAVCKADAKNGEMEVSASQVKESEIEIPYSLYLTSCVEVKNVNFEAQPTFGTLRIDGKKIMYKLKPSDGKEHNDQFKYIVTTINGEILKANFTVKIKK